VEGPVGTMASLHCCAHWMRRHEKFVSYIFKNVLALAHLLGATSCEALSYLHHFFLMLRYFLYLMLRLKNFSCIFINVESFTSCCIMNYIKFDCSLNEKNFFCTDCQDPTSKFDNLSSEFHNFTSQFHNTISKFHNSSFTIRPSSFGIRPQSFTIRVSESVLHFSQSTSTNSSTAAFFGFLGFNSCYLYFQGPISISDLCLPIWICTVLRVSERCNPLTPCPTALHVCVRA